MPQILAIDQGTTSTRAILFDAALRPLTQAQEEFPQHFPASGWVEHDPADLWRTTLSTIRAVLAKTDPAKIACIGITNQRETTLIWDRETGIPIANAIVWQDRRTADTCAALRAAGHEAMITAKTGLLLDPYFSGTKLKYLLDTLPDARNRVPLKELTIALKDIRRHLGKFFFQKNRGFFFNCFEGAGNLLCNRVDVDVGIISNPFVTTRILVIVENSLAIDNKASHCKVGSPSPAMTSDS